jgi:hypothetical protein
MKNAGRFSVLCLLGVLVAFPALGTPSSTIWTNCTLDIQPAGVTHLTYDTYTTVGKSPGESFPTDYGLTRGVKLGSKLAAEFGFDYFASSAQPWAYNAKIGFPENKLSKNAPAVEVGFFNFGDTKQNIVHFIVGKSLPNGKTRLSASYYAGNSDALRSSTGDKANTGFMVAVDHQLVPGKWVLAADYASGKNAIGGGSIGATYYFTKDVSLLAGPVWFNDAGLNGSTKLTVQLDINF